MHNVFELVVYPCLILIKILFNHTGLFELEVYPCPWVILLVTSLNLLEPKHRFGVRLLVF